MGPGDGRPSRELVGEYRIDYATDAVFKGWRDGVGWIRKPVGTRCVTRDGEWEVTDSPEVWTKKVWTHKTFWGLDTMAPPYTSVNNWGMAAGTIPDPMTLKSERHADRQDSHS